MLCLTFPENGLNFVTQRSAKSEGCLFPMFKIFVFDLTEALKPLFKTLAVIDFDFKQFRTLCLALPANCFIFVSQKFSKNCKLPFSYAQNNRF